jgi:DNA-binding transcriptional regulator YiaG
VRADLPSYQKAQKKRRELILTNYGQTGRKHEQRSIRRKAEGAMAAEELRSILKTIGMRQTEFAEALRVTNRAVQYWVKGERAISGPVASGARDLLRQHERRTARSRREVAVKEFA